MAKTDILSLALPGAILEFGQAIAAAHAGIRNRPGSPDASAKMGEIESRLFNMVKANPNARKLIGIRDRQDESERRVRLRSFALLAFRVLGQQASNSVSEISDLAAATMDAKLSPGEAILRARNIIGKMAAEDVLIAIGGEEGGPCNKIFLPARSQEWLTGGKTSFGFLTAAKLAGAIVPKGFDGAEDQPPAPLKIPSANELRTHLCKRIIGLEHQAFSLSSLFVLHLARAKLLQAGNDPGTGNQAVLLAGNSGCGKTFLLSEAARLTGCPFASVSATSMTSEGYIGGKLDDLFRALLAKAKGDLQASRYSIGFIDEWDKKSSRFSSGRDGVTTTALQTEVLVPMQGGEFLISGKRTMERPMTFNSNGTFFAFAGAFTGLAELIRKKTSSSCIGFSSGIRTKRQDYILDAIRDYGYIREWVNRLTSVMFLPDPSLASLEKAAVNGVLESFNSLVGELGIVLFPHQNVATRMAEYSLESRTFYRGVKSIWWSIAQSVVASGKKGTVLVGKSDVDAAISRVASGSGGVGDHPTARNGDTATDEADTSSEAEFAGA